MKKLSFLVIVLLIAGSFGKAQTRVSLLEEFTGESCPPCASYNPALDFLLEQPANASKMIAIKWQVPIPVAPFSPLSLYQTNQAEIDWRYLSASNGGYGYPAQYTANNTIHDGILNAPTCFIDGKNQWTFGAASDHPYYLKSNIINTAASVFTPFSIAMAPAWNSTFNNCVVTVTVSSSAAFTALGNLMFRLCLVERYAEFQYAPGTNGEKKFHDAVRKCYPVTTSGGAITNIGTALPSVWTAGQTQVLTINCAIPSYIMDKSQMAFVGFVQDDGDKQVYQTARTAQPSIPNDAKAEAVKIPLVVCSSTATPRAVIKNNGPNAITALTITPLINGSPSAGMAWGGNILPGASATIQLIPISLLTGVQHYGFTISGVSGGDIVPENNQKEIDVYFASSYFPTPISEGFESPAFPPNDWTLSNSGALSTFEISMIAGGYGLSNQSLTYPLYYAPIGEKVDLYLPPSNLAGPVNSELRFDLAYQQLGSSKDSLKVLLSSDCGNTWSAIYSDGGISMATAPLPVGNNAFAPVTADWNTQIIPLATYVSSPEVLIKFQVKGDGGNGLFIDNINLKGGTANPTNTTGIMYVEQSDLRFTMYPNPAKSNATLVISSAQAAPFSLELENSLGQVVYSRKEHLTAGSNTINVDCRNLFDGIYFVKVKSENSSGTKKLLISN